MDSDIPGKILIILANACVNPSSCSTVRSYKNFLTQHVSIRTYDFISTSVAIIACIHDVSRPYVNVRSLIPDLDQD